MRFIGSPLGLEIAVQMIPFVEFRAHGSSAAGRAEIVDHLPAKCDQYDAGSRLQLHPGRDDSQGSMMGAAQPDSVSAVCAGPSW
jgi:hypothetical protein